MLKEGKLGEKVTFTDADFTTFFGTSDYTGITLKSLPDANTGSLLLTGLRPTVGVTVPRHAIAHLAFIPATPVS